jgi:hypothetical protein
LGVAGAFHRPFCRQSCLRKHRTCRCRR